MEEHPRLSDQKLSNLLTARGIPIKRRTVTKYRHELGLKLVLNEQVLEN